ncbi:MAG TPA: DUF6114 domain-containing protein [Dictyobacter sp.]|jgi:hypothetical protein|nr:DUF6114 domain-containing protein [Dictyobacter sp.]
MNNSNEDVGKDKEVQQHDKTKINPIDNRENGESSQTTTNTASTDNHPSTDVAIPEVPTEETTSIVTTEKFALLLSIARLPQHASPYIRKWITNFRLWRLQRPFWGSLLMIIASLLMSWGPVTLLRFALFPGSTIWSGLLVGSLLFVMGIIQMFVPSYALITGAVGVVLSLISLFVAGFGGLIIGMLMGIVGGALGVAWRPNARPLPIKQTQSHPTPKL